MKVTHRLFQQTDRSEPHVVCDVGANPEKLKHSIENDEVTCKKCLKIINTKNHNFYGNLLTTGKF